MEQLLQQHLQTNCKSFANITFCWLLTLQSDYLITFQSKREIRRASFRFITTLLCTSGIVWNPSKNIVAVSFTLYVMQEAEIPCSSFSNTSWKVKQVGSILRKARINESKNIARKAIAHQYDISEISTNPVLLSNRTLELEELMDKVLTKEVYFGFAL